MRSKTLDILFWLLIVAMIVIMIVAPKPDKEPQVIEKIVEKEVIVEVPVEIPVEVPVPIEVIKELVPESEFMTYIGDFTVTAYCPCARCCGKWAEDRPTAYNRTVVNTAGGCFAEEGVTIAIDPSVIPFGAKVYIEGVGVRVAQDTGVYGKHIDVYYESHSDAWNSGLNDHPRKVWIVNEDVELIS